MVDGPLLDGGECLNECTKQNWNKLISFLLPTTSLLSVHIKITRASAIAARSFSLPTIMWHQQVKLSRCPNHSDGN